MVQEDEFWVIEGANLPICAGRNGVQEMEKVEYGHLSLSRLC